jgi:alcohol dehydrogenase
MANNDPHREPLELFAAHSPVRIVFGDHSVERVGELTRELGARKALLVTDHGIVAAGHADRVRQSLAEAGIAVQGFDQVEENPGTACVRHCAEAARAAGIDLFIGLGGGSSMDTAKGANFLLTNGGRMQDYWGIGKASRPMLPLIAIPTTAGTGSECQSFALITDENTHQKMACGDSKAAARIAILDPCLTVSQPPRVTACAGIDTFAHALETAVTRKRTAVSLRFSHQAGRLAFSGFPEVLRQPDNVAARGRMLLGAALAGAAIEASMLGAAHATANPLTANYGTVHGQAVGMMLPLVVRFNARDAETQLAYAEFAAAAGLVTRGGSPEVAVETLVGRLEWLLNAAGFPRSLAALGVRRESVPELAAEAARQWTGSFNPRPVSVPDFIELYAAALEERADGLAP